MQRVSQPPRILASTVSFNDGCVAHLHSCVYMTLRQLPQLEHLHLILGYYHYLNFNDSAVMITMVDALRPILLSSASLQRLTLDSENFRRDGRQI
jgi:hypothetical protein